MAKSIHEAFSTNEQVENEGQWFNFGPSPLGPDQRVKLARMSRSNKKYTTAVQSFSDKYERQLHAKTLAEEVAHEAMLEIFCKTVLVDWEGIPNGDGTELLPYSYENARDLMNTLPEFYKELQELAQAREHYQQQRNEETAGN